MRDRSDLPCLDVSWRFKEFIEGKVITCSVPKGSGLHPGDIVSWSGKSHTGYARVTGIRLHAFKPREVVRVIKVSTARN